MEEQIFCDGIGRIAIIGGIVRLDLFTYSPTETDANGNPRPILSHRIVMGTDGFLHSSEKVVEAVQVIQRARQPAAQPPRAQQPPTPQQPVPPPASPQAQPPAPQAQPPAPQAQPPAPQAQPQWPPQVAQPAPPPVQPAPQPVKAPDAPAPRSPFP